MAKMGLGQVTFRLPPVLHAELLEAATRHGLKVTDLILSMISECLPTYTGAGTTDLTPGSIRARVEATGHSIHAEQIRRAVAEATTSGRGINDFQERIKVLILSALSHGPLEQGDLETVVAEAEERLALERGVAQVLQAGVRAGEFETVIDRDGATRYRLRPQKKERRS
jgi:hypothetical protein